MPSMTTLLLFAGASLLLLIVPGPAVTYIVARSASYGRRAGLVSVLGIHAGSIVHVVAAVVGLSALIASSAAAYDTVRLAGAGYLIFLGISRLRRRHDSEHAALSKLSLARVFFQAMMVNVLNPKTSLFFLAFLPQFVDPARGGVALQTLILGSMFILLGAASDGTYALVASKAGHLMRRSRRFVRTERWLSGGTLIALGISAALTGHRPRSI